MKYKFFKERVSQSTYIGVKPMYEGYEILFRFMGPDWSTSKIQKIIEGVDSGRNKPRTNPYQWANEDVHMISNENGVFMVDTIAMRVGEEDPKKLEYSFTHDEIVKFLEDFKDFVEKNS